METIGFTGRVGDRWKTTPWMPNHTFCCECDPWLCIIYQYRYGRCKYVPFHLLLFMCWELGNLDHVVCFIHSLTSIFNHAFKSENLLFRINPINAFHAYPPAFSNMACWKIIHFTHRVPMTNPPVIGGRFPRVHPIISPVIFPHLP